LPTIRSRPDGGTTEISRYWNQHTVLSSSIATADESLQYLEWRFDEYPLFREFSGLWGEHDGEVILDYGCGPGNDVTGFLVHTDAAKVIGADVSKAALALVQERVSLHRIDPSRVDLVLVADTDPGTGLPDDSVDYVQSIGALQHASDPLAILRELRRVARPGREGRIMVYNRDSVWLHLYVAYVKMVLEGRYAGMSVDEAFGKTTDGEDCPRADAYTPAQMSLLFNGAGFDSEFLGGYPSKLELELLREHRELAIADERLAEDHRAFLAELSFDSDGYPLWRGKHAGVGAMYKIWS
jgi:SAM-dependent methyltransferase